MKYTQILFRLLGLVLFIFIFLSIPIIKVLEILHQASVDLLLIALFLSLPLLGSRSIRWNHILRRFNIDNSYFRTLYLFCVAGFSTVTPARTGEAVKSLYLHSEGHSLYDSLITIVLDRCFDLVVIGVTAGVYLYYSETFEGIIYLSAAMGFISMCLLGLLLISWKWTFKQFRALFHKLITTITGMKANFGSESSYIPAYRKQLLEIPRACVFSIIALGVQALQIWIFGKAIGVNISYLSIMGIVALTTIVNLLPITFLGLGTRDAVFIFFMGQIGVESHLSFALSFIVLGEVAIFSMLGAILFMMFPPYTSRDFRSY